MGATRSPAPSATGDLKVNVLQLLEFNICREELLFQLLGTTMIRCDRKDLLADNVAKTVVQPPVDVEVLSEFLEMFELGDEDLCMATVVWRNRAAECGPEPRKCDHIITDGIVRVHKEEAGFVRCFGAGVRSWIGLGDTCVHVSSPPEISGILIGTREVEGMVGVRALLGGDASPGCAPGDDK